MKKLSKHSEQIVDKLAALGDKNRYKIIEILSKDNDICVSGVASKIGITTAGVSQHMRILEQAGLIKKLRKGQKMCYQIDETSPDNSKLLRILIN